MYLDFFSLKKFPFRITPDPSMFFPGGANGPGVVLNALVYAVTSGEGIVKVVGEVGSGKTMLCRMLEERLPDTVEIVYLANPSLSARDIIYAIAFELDLDVDASTERLMVMHKLQEYLVKKHSEGGTVVVFIEEAQGMPIETLEEIRLLSNLETHRHKLMQIILFGQPELDKNLQGKNIRQLRERITHSFYLEPMNQDQTSDYLHYRMQAAGCPWPQVFTPKAERLLNKASEGLTRRVNILADKSLMAAYASSSIQPGHEFGAIQQKVLPQHVKAAIKDSGYGKRYLLPRIAIISSISAVALAMVLYFGINAFQFGQQQEAQEQAIIEINSSTTEPEAVIAETPSLLIPTNETQNEIQEEAASEEVLNLADEIIGENLPLEQALVNEPENEIVDLSPDIESITIEPINISDSSSDLASTMQESELIAQGVETSTTPTQINQQPRTQESSRSQEQVEVAIVINPFELEEQTSNGAGMEDEAIAFSELSGLVGVRARVSSAWLQNMAGKNSYTVQMASFSISDQLIMEEYLQLLSLANLLDETYLCLISRTASRPQQWLVMHGDFIGVSRARNYINSLPTYSRQYEPFVRNSNSIACLSDMSETALLAF